MSLFKRHPKVAGASSRDEDVAVERYEYLLSSAQPDQLNAIHSEAFANLTDDQRNELFTRLSDAAREPGDRPIDAAPATLARVATDTETSHPGSLARILGPDGAGSQRSGSLLAAIAALVVASPLSIALFPYDYGAGTGLWNEDADDDIGY